MPTLNILRVVRDMCRSPGDGEGGPLPAAVREGFPVKRVRVGPQRASRSLLGEEGQGSNSVCRGGRGRQKRGDKGKEGHGVEVTFLH